MQQTGRRSVCAGQDLLLQLGVLHLERERRCVAVVSGAMIAHNVSSPEAYSGIRVFCAPTSMQCKAGPASPNGCAINVKRTCQSSMTQPCSENCSFKPGYSHSPHGPALCVALQTANNKLTHSWDPAG